MSANRYEVLKTFAARHQIPVAELINEVLNRKLKLEQHARLKERLELLAVQRVNPLFIERLRRALEISGGKGGSDVARSPSSQRSAIDTAVPSFLAEAPEVEEGETVAVGVVLRQV
jgi:hypothetical protein